MNIIVHYCIIIETTNKHILHPVSLRRFPSFRTQPLENLSVDSVTKYISEQPSPWRKSSWNNTKRVVSNRVVSKGPLYPSKTKTVTLLMLPGEISRHKATIHISGAGFAPSLQIWLLGTTPFDTTPFICLRSSMPLYALYMPPFEEIPFYAVICLIYASDLLCRSIPRYTMPFICLRLKKSCYEDRVQCR